MAASFNESQKIDYLWKKVGYGVTKTAEPASKEAFNESIASPLLYRGDLIWTQSGDIPATPPASTTSLVQVYKDGVGSYSPAVQCTEDLTAPDNQTWKTNSTNWIPTQFGDNYLVQVYAGAANISNPQTAGTKLFGAGSGSDDTWFFDYQSGVLNFNGATIPTAIGTGTANTIYVVGYRYVGEFGVDTTFISNGTSNVNIASSNANVTISVNGTSNVAVFSNTGAYITGAVSASGNITGGNILSNNYYYANGTPVPPGITYTANTAPPTSPAPKVTDQWYDTASDVLYQYIDDGTSDYWVDTTSPAFAGGVVANVAISGTLVPVANVTYDIGTSTVYFRNTYTQSLYTNNRLTASNMPSGAVVQTVMSTSLGGSATTGTSYSDIALANVIIQPSSANSKVLIIATGTSSFTPLAAANLTASTQLVRTAASLQIQDYSANIAGGGVGGSSAVAFSYLDSPGTTSPVTYKMQQKISNSASTLTSSNMWIIAMEIAVP
jgi:hypothetical protein